MPYLVSVMRYTSSSKKEPRNFFEKKLMVFWQKNEGVKLDDGNFVGPKRNLYLCCSSGKRTVSVSFFSFEKFELRMWKNFFEKIFVLFFAKKYQVRKHTLTAFLGQKVAYETLVKYTKPWTLYLVSVLINRRWKVKNSKNLHFFFF